ncbi:hypothetical protein KPH14_010080 [Odynerus spinipes]|uniref:Gustatory receptor n=1 Tax=Odynerus spinipes TaxID=1348599 RepID=A0AAD9VSH5_9HYME|nr:hypothetical protein KPH14_010080 [Odynerus spinipes]
MHVRWNERDNKKRGTAKVGDVKNEGVENKLTMNTDIFPALYPIYHLSKLCGLFPVRFTKQANGRCEGHLNVIDVIYSLCLFGLIMSLEGLGLWRELRDGWENSTRLKNRTAVIPTASDILSVIILATIAVLGSPFRWKHEKNVLNKLAEVDEMMGIVALKKTRRYTIALTACTLPYLLITSSLDMYWWDCDSKANRKMDDKGPINFFPIYIMYTIIIILEIQYSLVTYNVGQRFVRLNKCLENILKNGKMTDHFRKDLGLAGDFKSREQPMTYVRQDPVHLRVSKTLERYPTAFERKNVANKIAQLVTVHSSLCDTVSSINNAFGLVMLAITLTCLLHLVITPYFLILEAKNTAVIVSQLLSSSTNEECRKHLEVFSLQLLHQPLDFTACGLFSFDRTLITSIAGAVTTYLVILIQFQKEDHTKDDVDNILKNATQILKNASSLHNLTTMKLNI